MLHWFILQVDLLLSFCSEMGFSSVILVGHDDGGLLALRAAEKMKMSGNSAYVSNATRFSFIWRLLRWIYVKDYWPLGIIKWFLYMIIVV